jgi:hypothetical protein
MDWLKSAGAETSKLRIKYYKQNKRGVVSNQDIRAGEEILFIPRNLIVTYEDISKTKLGDQLINKVEHDRMKTVGIATYILMSKLKNKETPCVELFPDNYNE